MKKYNTLKDELTKAMQDEAKKKAMFERLSKTFTNEALILDALTSKQIMHLLQFEQLEKALKNQKYTLIHDSNFENSKAQTVQTHIYSYIDSANKRVLHIYSHDSTLDIVFSSNKATLEKTLIADTLNSEFTIHYKYDKYEIDLKETKLARVAFDDMIKAVDFAKLILESSIDDLRAYAEAEKQNEAI